MSVISIAGLAILWSFTTDERIRRRRMKILIPIAVVLALAAVGVMLTDLWRALTPVLPAAPPP